MRSSWVGGWAAAALAALGCSGSPSSNLRADAAADMASGTDVAGGNTDVAGGNTDATVGNADVATGVDGPAGFFIVGDIDGITWLATHNIGAVENNFLFEQANVEPATDSPYWHFNFTLPADPLPYTLECVSNYIQLIVTPERRFVSRTATSFCNVTFIEPATPGTVEGIFSGNLTLRGTTLDYPLTNGYFRLPRAQQ
jgi:hypothetical protein